MPNYRIGDRVVYTLDKYTDSPGRRAKNVFPAPYGESYQYQVDKYWLVLDVQPDGHVVLQTRRGKLHVVAVDDPRLRKASWFERLWRGHRFPAPVQSQKIHHVSNHPAQSTPA